MIGFDIADNIPAGSTITSVQLSLVLALAPSGDSMASPIELHPLVADWGEGTAGQGTGPDGIGMGFMTPPDGTTATWSHRFFNTVPWVNPGADFMATASGTAMVGASLNATYTWNSMRPWSTMSNRGLIIPPVTSAGYFWATSPRWAAVESSSRVKRPNSAVRPSLVITYTPPVPAAAHRSSCRLQHHSGLTVRYHGHSPG